MQLTQEVREYANRPANLDLSVRIHRIEGFDPEALARCIDRIALNLKGWRDRTGIIRP